MIRRRLLVLAALTAAVFTFGAGSAGADNGNILCLYAKNPPGIGLCVGI